ncbi:MAG: septum formation protein Maf [Rhodobacteraceae bacterium]|nr:septum formation protein Maf [Paracoccaceae bacterium]
MKLVLGSASLRRLELLARIGVIPHDVRPTDIDETPLKGELPRLHARRLAAEKASALVLAPDEVALTADTIVAAGRRIMAKPADAREASAFLQILSGRRHMVITGVALRTQDRLTVRDVATRVRFRRLSAEDVSAYLGSGEWQGKAGGYAIQGRAAAFIPSINGSYSNVVGLPLAETAGLLQSAGVL